MAEYNRFDSLVRYISKGAREKTSRQVISELHEAFVSCLPQLPEDLKHDIAYYFEDLSMKKGDSPVSFLAEKLNEVLYLFEEDYHHVTETFTRDDWEYLKNVVSDFALDMDQERLTYIMRCITSRGVIDR